MKKTYLLLLTVIISSYWFNLNGQAVPRQGEILITEIMVNPEVVSDANGEWFEIWNNSNHDLLLNGLVMKDAGSNQHVITSAVNMILTAGSYWLLARNGDGLTNGGVAVNYIFQNFTLGNTSDQLIITAADNTLIDQVSYGPGWPVVSGASMELIPAYHSFSGNDQPEHWLPAKMTFGSGDKGSPGKPNPTLSGSEGWEQGIRLDVFPNPSEGRFMMSTSFQNAQSGEIRMINLLGQDYLYKSFQDQQVLREVIEPDYLTPGIWFLEILYGRKTKVARLVIEK